MNDTIIRWTDLSWNVWSGCSQVSPGCAHCYAKRIAKQKRGPAFPNGFDLTYRWHKLGEPLKLKEPKRIFVNSMSDLFYEPVPDHDIRRVFDVMNECHVRGLGHQFQILTKRSARLLALSPQIIWTPNIQMGISVENERFTYRIGDLVRVPAAVRFLSVEPLLGPINLRPWLTELDWVIVGGESGPDCRVMDLDHARRIRDDCLDFAVPFYFKQSSGWRTELGQELDGVRWEQYPANLAVNLRGNHRAPVTALAALAT